MARKQSHAPLKCAEGIDESQNSFRSALAHDVLVASAEASTRQHAPCAVRARRIVFLRSNVSHSITILTYTWHARARSTGRTAVGRNIAASASKTRAERQAKVLALLCEGRSNKEIAHDLGVSQSDVKYHVTRLLRRHDAQSRMQLLLKVTSQSRE